MLRLTPGQQRNCLIVAIFLYTHCKLNLCHLVERGETYKSMQVTVEIFAWQSQNSLSVYAYKIEYKTLTLGIKLVKTWSFKVCNSPVGRDTEKTCFTPTKSETESIKLPFVSEHLLVIGKVVVCLCDHTWWRRLIPHPCSHAASSSSRTYPGWRWVSRGPIRTRVWSTTWESKLACQWFLPPRFNKLVSWVKHR